MGRFDNIVEIYDTRPQILEAIPDACKDCDEAEIMALSFASLVVKESVSLEVARQEFRGHIEDSCAYGLAMGKFGEAVCNINVTCQMPPGEPYHKDLSL